MEQEWHRNDDVRAILAAARDLISDPARWCQGQAMRKAKGHDPTAWCMVGAVAQAAAGYSGGRCLDAWRALRTTVGQTVARYNDTHSHAEVLACFDQALAGLPTLPEAPDVVG